MGGAVIIIWLIIFAINASRGKEKAAKKATDWPRVIGILIWVAAIIALLVSAPYDTPARVAALIVALFMLLPSVWIHLPVKAGWIAPSYYLSFLLLIINGQALRAGAAFNAYRALLNKRIASGDFRRETISRLRGKAMRNKGNITSSDMLLCVLLDTDQDTADAMRRLETMYLLRKETVSSRMVRFAFARLMASALAEENWKKIALISNSWRSKWTLPLASLIECCYHRHMKTRAVNPVTYRYLWLRCGCPRWIPQLPLDKAEDGVALDQNDPAQLKQRLVQCALSDKAIDRDNLSLEHLLPAEQFAVWKQRAQALHCRTPEAAVASIERSLTTIAGNTAADQPMTTASGQDIDEALTRLRYHAESIHRRQAGRQLQAGSVEFQEWLNFVSVYEQLASDSSDRYEAYSLVEVIVWNWMADLWNIKKERHLAFMICGYMNPHAREFGSEASRVYEQVLRGQLG